MSAKRRPCPRCNSFAHTLSGCAVAEGDRLLAQQGGVITCPACGLHVIPGEVPADERARRLTRFASCLCGAQIQIKAYEGWERWYSIAYRVGIGAGWIDDPHKDEFYARESVIPTHPRACHER